MKKNHLINPNRGKHKIIPAVEVLLVKDGKVFMMLRSGTGFSDGKFGFPGGHVEPDEMPLQAAIREAKEEAGVDIQPEDLVPIYVIYRLNSDNEQNFREYIGIFFMAKKWVGEPRNAEPHKCSYVVWFDLNNLPSNIVYYLPTVVQGWQKGEFYTEHVK